MPRMGRVPNENRGRNQKPVPVILKHLLFIIIVLCGIAITSSCKRESFTEYRLE